MYRQDTMSDMEWLGEEELDEADAGLYESSDLGENWEDEMEESDQFIGKFLKKLPMGGLLKKIAKKAAITAGSALGGPVGGKLASVIANKALRETEAGVSMEAEFESESEFESAGGNMEILNEMNYLAEVLGESDNEEEADHFLGAIASLAGPLLGSLLGETEYEFETESMESDQYDMEEMEDLSLESESDQFLPALLPLAAKVLPMAMPLVKKGIKAIGKAVTRSPRTRRLARQLPKIALGTVNRLASAAQKNKPITKRMVVGTLARQAVKAINSPSAVRAIRRPSKIDPPRAFAKPYATSRPVRTFTGNYAGMRPYRRLRRMVCYY